MSRDFLVLMGVGFFCAGLLIQEQTRLLEQQRAVLYDVACDNMALRFHIHNTEVENSA